ncbi:MAG: NADPH2:quinone reductase [Pseudoalteromonas tetraodonis]
MEHRKFNKAKNFMSAPKQATRLFSTVKASGTVELSLTEAPLKDCAENEIIVRVEATPINPSDLAVMFSVSDPSKLTVDNGVLSAPIAQAMQRAAASRVDVPIPCGNEGAGTVVAAGSSAAAQSMLGKTVAVMAGGMYSTFRKIKTSECIPFPEGVTAREAASSFVNPLTAQGFIGTMRLEGHSAIIHTAAASNLGQMLCKLCQADGVPLINIVRKPEQEKILKDLGATHVINSSSPRFMKDLIAACTELNATLAFDATGGGQLANQLLMGMEAAAAANMTEFSAYGSTTHKQVYLYGGLDRSATTLNRGYGMAWGVGGWLMPNHLQRVGPEAQGKMFARVAQEIRGIFVSSYNQEISLREMLSLDAASKYTQQATGLKYLVNPQK